MLMIDGLTRDSDLYHSFPMRATATPVHVGHHNCLEVIVTKGRSRELEDLANEVLSLRGVKRGQLAITNTGKHLE